MLVTLLAAFVLLGAVIFVHELGHFLAAKAVGIGVPRFSIGFGAATPLKFQWGETEYVVAWIPLGGYVKMATREDEGDGVSAIEGGRADNFPDEKLFENKPLWARAFVLSAGVIMNAVLAWAIYTGIAATVGATREPTTTLAGVVDSLLPPAAAELSTLPFGATITMINGDSVRFWEDVRDGVLDIRSDRLRIDFADGLDPVILRIPGTAATERVDIYRALIPLREARIDVVTPGRPGSRAGLQAGDLIVRTDGDSVRHWGDLLAAIGPAAGDTVVLTVLRRSDVLEIALVPDEVPESTRDPTATGDRKVGFIGIGPFVPIERIRFGVVAAVGEGLRQTVGGVAQVAFTVRALVTARVSPKELGGPIIIGQLSGQAARLGPTAFMGFMAFISINLAIFNLLPIPVLDGGHLMFLLIEGITRKPVSVSIKMRFTQVGLAALLVLVVFVIFNDLYRIIGG